MIFKLSPSELKDLLNVVNDAAQAYKGIIPDDRWKEPYMSSEELEKEIGSGVEFYGWKEDGVLAGVMGMQLVRSVTLIRHAYVLASYQRRGIGERLLKHLMSLARTSWILVGTWEAAHWAVRFYEKFVFTLVSEREKEALLREYWNIPQRQIETSVVLKLEIHC